MDEMSHEAYLKFNEKYGPVLERLNIVASELVNGDMRELSELMDRVDDIFGSVLAQITNKN